MDWKKNILNNFNSLFSLLNRKYPEIKFNQWNFNKLNGKTGRSFLVQSKNKKIRFVARFLNNDKHFLGISLVKESKILNKLNLFIHSPKLLAKNRDWLLIEWISGKSIRNNLNSFWKISKKLGNILVKLHSVGLSGYSLELKRYFFNCFFLVDLNRLSFSWLKLHRFFQNSRQPKIIKTAIAHLDIHSGNILLTNTGILKLLDWEYSLDCDIAFDLASLFLNNNWSKDLEKHFLKIYCDIDFSYKDFFVLEKRILMWKPWVNYMRLLWYEVQWNKTKNEEYLKLSYSIRKFFNLE